MSYDHHSPGFQIEIETGTEPRVCAHVHGYFPNVLDPKLKYGKKKNRHKSIQKFILIKMD
jgi:hypothetical protein